MINKSLSKFTAALALLPLGLSAATVTWTGGTTDFELGSNWGGSAPVDDNSTDVAALNGGTVTVTSSRSVGGLDFAAATTTTLDGIETLTVGPTGGLTGSGDLILTGGGGLTLSGGNDHALNFTGGITIGTGTTLNSDRFSLKLDTSTQEDTTITLDGGTLRGGFNHLDLDGRNIDLTANGGTLFHKHARNFYNIAGQVISGSGQLTIKGEGSTASGRIELDGGVNTYTGGTRIESGGHARINSDAALGLAGTSITFNDGNIMLSTNVDLGTRALIVESDSYGQFETGGRAVSIGGAISGAGELIFNGGGSVNLESQNNTHGSTTLDGVQVNLYGATNALGTGAITLDNGATIKNRNNHITLTNAINLGTGEGTYGDEGTTTGAKSGGQFEAGWSKTININGKISGGGSLTFRSDSGTFNVSHTAGNDYTGETIIEGNVQGRDGSFGVNATGGAISFNNDGSLVATHNLNLGTRAVTLDGDASVRVFNGRAMTFDGVVDGAGELTVGNDGGAVRLSNTGNTYSGGTVIIGRVNANSGSLGTGDITMDDQNGARGWLQNFGGAATHANNFIISDTNNGGRFKAGWNSDLTVTGVVSGAGGVVIEGDSGRVVWSNAANTYSGVINLEAATSTLSVESLGAGATITGDAGATFIFTGDADFDGANAFAGEVTISADGSVTGSGSLAGDLTLEAGAKFAYTGEILTVAGTVTLDSTFGVDDLTGIASLDEGTYTLIAGTLANTSFGNFGSGNAFDLGGGKTAYFQEGSLQLVVVPEPGTFALLAGTIALGSVMMRRRRS